MNEREQKNTEAFITRSVDRYIEYREKDWEERTRIQRIWNWIFVVVSLASIFLCALGIRFFVQQGRVWNDYILHQTVLSEQRESRELLQARRDSVKSARDDSLAVVYIKSMKHYAKIPDHK
jgi:hypothetical protein